MYLFSPVNPGEGVPEYHLRIVKETDDGLEELTSDMHQHIKNTLDLTGTRIAWKQLSKNKTVKEHADYFLAHYPKGEQILDEDNAAEIVFKENGIRQGFRLSFHECFNQDFY